MVSGWRYMYVLRELGVNAAVQELDRIKLCNAQWRQ